MNREVKKFLKRMLALGMVLCLVLTLYPAVYAESDNPYAEVIFGANPKMTNLNLVGNFALLPETAAGREGSLTDIATKKLYAWVDLDDSVIYDLPDDTATYITVEYFDSEKGWFNIAYDSHHPPEYFGTVQGQNYKASEKVFMQGSGEWKSYTFYLTDFRAKTSLNNIADFRLAVWTPNNDYSTGDVLFGSLRVEVGEHETPVVFDTPNLGYAGNHISAAEESAVEISMRNRAEEEVEVKWNFEIYNSNEIKVDEFSHISSLAPREEKDEEVVFENPKKHGLYTMKIVSEVSYKSNPDKFIKRKTEEREMKFSVGFVFDKDTYNHELGAVHQISGERGTAEDMASLLVRGGMALTRDDVTGGSIVDGKWQKEARIYNSWKTLSNAGLKTIGILGGANSYAAGVPETPQELEEWEKYCFDIATQMKGVIDWWEIWNEPNLRHFNSKMNGPVAYTKACEVAAKAVRAANPDAVIFGLDIAGMDFEWMETAMQAGCLEYIDVMTLHPYDWTGYFDEQLYISNATKVLELINKYNPEVELWITETGFSSYTNEFGPVSGSVYGERERGHTLKEQYQRSILQLGVNKAYDLYKRTVWYCLYDRTDRGDIGHNWGIVNMWDEHYEETPGSAKPVYVAMTAWNKFLNHNAEIKEKIVDGRTYALNFYNNEMNKNVLFLQSGSGSTTKGFNLGCKSVDLYDAFGNKLATLPSANGEYSFIIDEEPYYVIGNFTSFTETAVNPVIIPEAVKTEAVGGDLASFKFTKTTDKELFITADGLEIKENQGFVNNEAELKFLVPARDSGEISCDIVISDKDGTVYYARKHEISILPPVEVTFATETADSFSGNFWRIKATVKNLGNEFPVSGTYKLKAPQDIVEANKSRSFKNLKPQESITFSFTVPERVNKRLLKIESEIALETGYAKEYSEEVEFTTAMYAKNKPVIDGVVSLNEWQGSWIGADEYANVNELTEGYKWDNADDLSFNGLTMWDEENFYYVGILRDDIDYTDCPPDNILRIWHGDSFQIGIDDRLNPDPMATGEYTEFGIGNVPGYGEVLYRYKSLYNEEKANMEIKNAEVCIKRYDGYTLYECSIPWAEIFYEGYEVNPDNPMRFSVLANDNDGDGRGFIEYSSGIGVTKDITLFGTMKFMK